MGTAGECALAGPGWRGVAGWGVVSPAGRGRTRALECQILALIAVVIASRARREEGRRDQKRVVECGVG